MPSTPPPIPLVDDDIIESQIIENQIEDIEIKENEPLNKEIVNIKESKDHHIDSVIEPKNVKEDIQDESWTMVMQEELNQFKTNDVWSLVPPPDNQTIIVPKAWCDRLKAFLLDHEYTMSLVDNTLFTKKRKSHIIIVQIYVDDIIFGSTCHDLWDDFSKIMRDEFKMSMIGELNFFLGLQIKQLEDDIFFNQSKYIKEMLKKFGLKDSKLIKTPMLSETKLTQDEDGESVDDTKYRGMIGSLLYLTASRLDIMFSVCLCGRFQEDPKTSHLEATMSIAKAQAMCAHSWDVASHRGSLRNKPP
ncbi:retrovirus-related pol polyprotein from transposon TNT 1-94 [Tanacetum coccineum]